MVRSGPGSVAGPERDAFWGWVLVVLAIGLAITIYVVFSARK